MKGSAFTKKINTAPQLYKQQSGVKQFPNQQYSISSGNESLDNVIGGGFPIGSIVLLLEDQYSHFFVHFLKDYLGEGIVHGHKNLIIDPDTHRSKKDWIKLLPQVICTKSKSTARQEESKETEELKVAWRYNSLLKEESKAIEMNQEQKIGYRFDNSKEMGSTIHNSMSHQLKKEELLLYLPYIHQSTNLIDLWEQIAETIQNNLKTEEDDQIFRLLFPDFNKVLPLFNSGKFETRKNDSEMIRFVRNLKAMARSTNGICLISMDEQMVTQFLLNNLIQLSDLVLKITSFIDNQEMKIGQYDGTIRILKEPRIHGFLSTLSEFDVYALQNKGKQNIVIEKIHLEPEESRAEQDENLQQKGVIKKSLGQNTLGQGKINLHNLDF